jgi:hypothetical protein
MNREEYLMIADVLSGIAHSKEGDPATMEVIVQDLAEAFEQHDSDFNRVQFLNDCEAVE